MRWLHLTDLHVGRADNQNQSSALDSMIREIDKQSERPFDAVFITGDITFSGQSDEYESAGKLIIEPLKRLSHFGNSQFFAVPGNHDLDCDAVNPVDWAGLGQSRQEKWFQENMHGEKVRQPRSGGFQNFSKFLEKFAIKGPNPLKNVSSVFTIDGDHPNSIRIITTNTAFFSDKEVSDEGKAAAPTPSLRYLFNNTRSTSVEHSIVLGHHPIEWLKYEHREPLKSLLFDEKALYLHGHRHRVQAIFAGNGMQSLGFGASYSVGVDAPPQSYYRNQFAICELRNQELHVKLIQWDNEVGKWELASGLPSEFSENSTLLSNGYQFTVACQKKRAEKTPVQPQLKVRSAPKIKNLICTDRMNEEHWRKFLLRTEVVSDRSLRKEPTLDFLAAKQSFTYQNNLGHHWIDCAAGSSYTISHSEVEAANTNIDRKGLASYTIVSLGGIADDARNFYLQIMMRKPLKIITSSDLIKDVSRLLGSAQKQVLADLDAADVFVELVYLDSSFCLLICEARDNRWFYVIDENGQAERESSQVVVRIRKARPGLTDVTYAVPDGTMPTTGIMAKRSDNFDKTKYLDLCYNEFNSVRYAALSTFGFRFHDIPLDEFYVPANCDVHDADRISTALTLAISSMLQEYDIDPPVRHQLEAQIRKGLGLGLNAERGAAKQWYQQIGSVIIAGDPGSGKTCFVKSEILAYCKDNRGSEKTWYSNHIPLFVSLSEAGRLIKKDSDLITIMAQLTAKRGLSISTEIINNLLIEGKLALFFDGLDEVVSTEQRDLLVSRIRALITDFRPIGNRFVVTSRPAAVQYSELLECLRMLTLQGLSEAEMRLLASRVLAARQEGNAEEARIDVQRLGDSDHSLVEQLIQDTRNIPGIGRLASNPLLLTLLMMIYVNSRGAPSAKRHRIYAQAVQTLVTERGRDIGQQRVLSEVDLRKRLGGLALSIYQDALEGVPSKKYVLNSFSRTMQAQRGAAVLQAEVEEFLQNVAESTGLLVIHTGNQLNVDATVTFMHHSFLEYYAAVGLHNTPNYPELIPSLMDQPRWREVISLLSGIASDTDDSCALIKAILSNQSAENRITLDRILFAIDCALESDVPSETVQLAIISSLTAVFNDGPALYDSYLRREIGERLAKLYANSRSERIEGFLLSGMDQSSLAGCAAYVDLIGHVYKTTDPSQAVLTKFSKIIQSRETPVILSVFEAVSRSEKLRIGSLDELIRYSLRGNFQIRYAAAQALEQVPALTKGCWDLALECLADNRLVVSAAIAAALFKAGLPVDSSDPNQRRVLLKALGNLEAMALPETIHNVPICCQRHPTDVLLSSPIKETRLIALRLLPWLKDEERFVYERLTATISDNNCDRDVLVAALTALKLASGVHRMLTILDVLEICKKLNAPYRDVRLAACNALSLLEGSLEIKEALESYITRNGTGGSEFRAAVYALVQSCQDIRQAQNLITPILQKRLKSGHAHRGGVSRETPRKRDTGRRTGGTLHFDSRAQQNRDLLELLRVCQRFDQTDDQTAGLLKSAVVDYSISDDIKEEALSLFARLVKPGKSAVEFYVRLADNPPLGLRRPIYRSISIFVRRCRGKIDYMRSVCPFLDALRDSLLSHVDPHKASGYITFTELETRVTELRRAVDEIEKIMRSHREFSRKISNGD